MICGFGKTRTPRVTSPLTFSSPTNPGTCLETVSQAVRTWRFTRVDVRNQALESQEFVQAQGFLDLGSHVI